MKRKKLLLLILANLLLILVGNLTYAQPREYTDNEKKMQKEFSDRLIQAKEDVIDNINTRVQPLLTNSSTHSFPTTDTISSSQESVEYGVRQLYLREELQNILTKYRRDVDQILTAWLAILNSLSKDFKLELQSLKAELEHLSSSSNLPLTDSQIHEIKILEEKLEYLTKNNPLLRFAYPYRVRALINHFSPTVKKMVLSGELDLDNLYLKYPNERKLPEVHNQVSKTVDELRKSFKSNTLAEFDRVFKEKPSIYYEEWTRNFSYGGQEVIKRFHQELEEYKSKLIATLQNACLLSSKQQEFISKLQRLNLLVWQAVPNFVQVDNNSKDDGLYFSIGTGIEGKYSYESAGLMIYPKGGYDTLRYHPSLVCLHGACTFHSNVKSFSDLVRISKVSYFLNISALDIWGSMEKSGIAIDLSSSQPEQLAFYLEHFYQSMINSSSVLKDSPFIVGGRSSGSSSEFIHAFYYHIAQKPIVTDLLYLVSFSNFLTAKEQLVSVQQQEQQGILTLVPNSSQRVTTLYKKVLEDLDRIKNQSPDLLVDEGFADNIFYVQGRRDLDGGSTVVDDLIRFSTTYTPLAHIYVFEDPLEKYPEFATFLEQFGQGEASHFLYNSTPNMTLEKIEGLIPPEVRKTLPQNRSDLIKLLPRYKDQLSEVIALKYAALDYIISSPFTDEGKRQQMIAKRYNLTHSYDKFSYFRWFIEQENLRIQESKKDIQPISFDQIKSKEPALKGSILRRYQKVYNFIIQELSYAEELYNQYRIDLSYLPVRKFSINKLIKTKLLVTDYGYKCVGLFKN